MGLSYLKRLGAHTACGLIDAMAPGPSIAISTDSECFNWPRLYRYDPRPSPNTTNGLPNGTLVPVWTGGDMTTPLLKRLGKYDLLAFMNARWKSYRYPDWDLWQHEFSKHAVSLSLVRLTIDML